MKTDLRWLNNCPCSSYYKLVYFSRRTHISKRSKYQWTPTKCIKKGVTVVNVTTISMTILRLFRLSLATFSNALYNCWRILNQKGVLNIIVSSDFQILLYFYTALCWYQENNSFSPYFHCNFSFYIPIYIYHKRISRVGLSSNTKIYWDPLLTLERSRVLFEAWVLPGC